MSATTIDSTPTIPSTLVPAVSPGEELVALGWEINANQYRVVHLAARFDEELDWFRHGHRSAASWISTQLQIHTSTAREWIRVGHALRYLPETDAAFVANEISYAKVRILTRWADDNNETELLDLARERNASRLTVAIAKVLADGDESDAERDARLHEERAFTTWTDGDGMTVMRIALPPSVAKPVIAAVDELVRRIAQTPMDAADNSAAVAGNNGERHASADAFGQRSVTEPPPNITPASEPAPAPGPARTLDPLHATLRELRRRWQPDTSDAWAFPSLAQQRADAFTALFLGCDVELTAEVVVHVRGDGTTFDDGTPTTDHAVLRHLDNTFIRLLVHDTERRPINASRRQRHPTTRQKRVVMETHNHECVDCQSTDLLELDHNPDFSLSRHTIVQELEPRCAPCHRSRHRHDLAA